MVRRVVVAFSLAMLTVHCGGGTPTAPTPTPTPSPTPAPAPVTSVAVSLVRELMNLGDTQQATVSPSVAGTWTSEPTGVVDVSQGGRVSAVRSGRTLVLFTTEAGIRGEAPLRVVPAYSGTWVGFQVVQHCTHTGELASVDTCGVFPPNRDFPIDARFQQTHAHVTGTIRLGQLPRSVEVTVPIADSGEITIATNIRFETTTFDIHDLRLNSTDGHILTGTMVQRITDTKFTGDVRVESIIRILERQ